ncbi:hypothetical protein BQ8794_130128 [Mesorhizobium prunaredense]|uniref:Uncharacterized protein n=1 Tax=Mesorhizobium prunaredense TaxID=1631249 RepID=A0A1R3V5H5_9HYPH|nr:hypothetical protein BQ8794_130128 [Mesorhizobium prunaredense]
MFRTLHCIPHYQTVSEVNTLVRAKPVGAEIFVCIISKDRKGATAMIEALGFLGFDVVGGTGVDPRHGTFLQMACGL